MVGPSGVEGWSGLTVGCRGRRRTSDGQRTPYIAIGIGEKGECFCISIRLNRRLGGIKILDCAYVDVAQQTLWPMANVTRIRN